VRAFLIIAAALCAAGCAPRDAEVRRQRLATERRQLEASLDELQARLLVNQARVRFWREMRDRHESVSAIACASMEAHAEDMARRLLRDEERSASRSSLHGTRVASLRSVGDPAPALSSPTR
jgi:hypothetical protein